MDSRGLEHEVATAEQEFYTPEFNSSVCTGALPVGDVSKSGISCIKETWAGRSRCGSPSPSSEAAAASRGRRTRSASGSYCATAWPLLNRDPIGSHTTTGVGFTMLAVHLSYTFDLRGPSQTMDTFSSTSSSSGGATGRRTRRTGAARTSARTLRTSTWRTTSCRVENITTFKASRSDSNFTNTGPNTFFSGLDYNSYSRCGGITTSLVNWVDAGGKNYTSLAALRTDHGWESHGHDLASGRASFFVSQELRNDTVRSSSPAYMSGKPLPADVAQVLGVAPGTVMSRGALNCAAIASFA